MRIVLLLLAIILAGKFQLLQAQVYLSVPCESTVEDQELKNFLGIACTATAGYKNMRNARNRGYRPLGPETPHMGQHWIAMGHAIKGKLDLKRPSVLTYTTVDGEPVLTGVAYMIKFAGELPKITPFEGATWHFHTGSLEEELIGGTHQHQNMDPEEMPETGIAMIHAWIWHPNPAGIFEPDNWYLPFLRTDWEMEVEPGIAASKAVFLSQNGAAYFEKLIGYALEDEDGQPGKYTDILKAYQASLSEKLESVTVYDASLQDELTAQWETLWQEIKAAVSRKEWHQIAPLVR